MAIIRCTSPMICLLLLVVLIDVVKCKLCHARGDHVRHLIDGRNSKPIIGVLSQEASAFIKRTYPNEHYHSYIAASYVKFVEGAGGRVVPIWIGGSHEYYKDILSKVNGVLLPGGEAYFDSAHGYAEASWHIYDTAVALNQDGIYMPIWGTCLGFEILIYLSANRTDFRISCDSVKQALPLEFKDGYNSSRLFERANEDVIHILRSYPVTANFHKRCFSQKVFAEKKLDDIWKILSLNYDKHNQQFISVVEHKFYPFYGVQFHPEKNIYEFIPHQNISHSLQAIQASQYFAQFFVEETRKNWNCFPDKAEELSALIYNYHPVYTERRGSLFEQQYLFKETPAVAEDNIKCSSNGSTPSRSRNVCDHARSAFILLVLGVWLRNGNTAIYI